MSVLRPIMELEAAHLTYLAHWELEAFLDKMIAS